MGLTFAEKILGQKVGRQVQAGEIVMARPDRVLSHDNSAAISKTFAQLGAKKVTIPDKVVIILDHCVPAASEKYAQNHQTIRQFVFDQQITNFYDIEQGVCHQVMPEKGLVRPGQLVLGSDSHTTTHGAFGAFSAGIGRSEAAALWATGEIWLRVPETMVIKVENTLPAGVFPKDLALHIIGKIGADGFKFFFWKKVPKKRKISLLLFLRTADMFGFTWLLIFLMLPWKLAFVGMCLITIFIFTNFK